MRDPTKRRPVAILRSQSKPKGKYTANGAKTTADAALTLISPATGGQDAFDAGLELIEPRFSANLFFDAIP